MSHHLVGVREIGTLLAVSRQRADQWTRTTGFPDPVVELASGRVWQKEPVMKWAARQHPPSDVVKQELAQLPKGRKGSAISFYRMVYAVVRQRGLGRHAQGIPPTREFAHRWALAEARKVDPGFHISLPAAG